MTSVILEDAVRASISVPPAARQGTCKHACGRARRRGCAGGTARSLLCRQEAETSLTTVGLVRHVRSAGSQIERQVAAVRTGYARVHDAPSVRVLMSGNRVQVFGAPGEDSHFA